MWLQERPSIIRFGPWHSIGSTRTFRHDTLYSQWIVAFALGVSFCQTVSWIIEMFGSFQALHDQTPMCLHFHVISCSIQAEAAAAFPPVSDK